MKKRVCRIVPKSTPAEHLVREYGQLVQIADETELRMRFVSLEERDVVNFKGWSFWLSKSEFDLEEFIIPN